MSALLIAAPPEQVESAIDATALPAGQSGLMYSIGFVIATGCLHGAGMLLGLVHTWAPGRTAIRLAGSMVALAGVVFLVRALA